MDFSPNKTPIEIKKVNLEVLILETFILVFSVNKYGVKYGTSLRFWENKGCINKIGPYGCFQWYFRYCLVEDRKMMKDKLTDGKGL